MVSSLRGVPAYCIWLGTGRALAVEWDEGAEGWGVWKCRFLGNFEEEKLDIGGDDTDVQNLTMCAADVCFHGKRKSTQISNNEGETGVPIFTLPGGTNNPTFIPQGVLMKPGKYLEHSVNFEYSSGYSFELWVYFYDIEINRIYLGNITNTSGGTGRKYIGIAQGYWDSAFRMASCLEGNCIDSQGEIKIGWNKFAFYKNSSGFSSYQYNSIDETLSPGQEFSDLGLTSSKNALGCFQRCDSSQFIVSSLRFRDDTNLGILGNSFSYMNPLATCGDGIVQREHLEECDDSHSTLPGCNEACLLESGYSCGKDPYQCFPAQCGDGYYATGEQCDDQNSSSGDGCSNTCQLEAGFACTGIENTTCTPICGDGIKISALKECEDGNTDDNDGCSSDCKPETDYVCGGWTSISNPDTCNTVCGNGVQNPRFVSPLKCDDGNTANGDGCDENCNVEGGYTCTSNGASVCTPLCGSGVVINPKECDDSNTNSNDGCSSECKVEEGYYCKNSKKDPSFCNKCKFNQEFEDSSIISRCGDQSNLESTSMSEGVSTSAQIATGISMGAVIGVSILNMSSLTGIWSLVNQFQLFLLLILTRTPLPGEINYIIAGNDLMSFDMSFLPVAKLPYICVCRLGHAGARCRVPSPHWDCIQD
ncbi:unnamed protein product [Moneuplotes crassus]|uniref:Uncharacterized protein n=1 Tax=Euplotes crassus TaxID=5936 RepID=A0AAD1XNC1_EUPCR|nr:unnamed protein product [Moneuplotes crassus]